MTEVGKRSTPFFILFLLSDALSSQDSPCKGIQLQQKQHRTKEPANSMCKTRKRTKMFPICTRLTHAALNCFQPISLSWLHSHSLTQPNSRPAQRSNQTAGFASLAGSGYSEGDISRLASMRRYAASRSASVSSS